MNKICNFLVYTVFLTTPLESVALFEGFSIVKLLTIFLFIAFLFNKQNIFNHKQPFLHIFLIYAILTILSIIWSIDKTATLNASLYMIFPTYFVTLMAYSAIKDRTHLERAFKAYAIGCLIVAIVAIYMFITGFRFMENSRLTVLGQDQNELSFLLSFGIVSVIYLLKYTMQKTGIRIMLFFLAFIFAFVILTTGSRTGAVILFFITLVIIIMSFRKLRIIYFVPFFLLASIIILNYLPESMSARILTTPDQIRNRDLSQRVEIWELGLSYFQQKGAYLFGTGFNTFYSLVDEAYAPHNTYLSTFIELGVLGSIIFLSLIINLLRKVIFLSKNDSVFNILLILPLILAMMTLGTETRRWLYLIGILIIKIWQFSKESEGFSSSSAAEI